MPLIETKGAASAQGFGEFTKKGVANYIEDVFSTYLFKGTAVYPNRNTITTGIDSDKGELIWLKSRTSANGNFVFDTGRGNNNVLETQNSFQQYNNASGVVFTSTGFTLGAPFAPTTDNMVSWNFRKQAKFFDLVTYTGNGANRTIAHSLGSVPGCIIVKRTDTTGAWAVYHRSLANTEYMVLNTTAAKATGATYWNSTTPTSTEFSLGTATDVNANGGTYVAYLFAHDAGGFGLTGTDNVISCGSFTTNGSAGADVSLGYEPQWVLIKASSSTSGWLLSDTMRGMSLTNFSWLFPNNSNAESANGYTGVYPTATGFNIQDGTLGASTTYIYIAIRRGPMKTPTSGTSVFSPQYATFSGTTVTDTGFVVDMVINKVGTNTTNNNFVFDRLRGDNNSTGQYVLPSTSSTSAETATSGYMALTGTVTIQNGFLAQDTTANNMVWAFRRAPGFFDVVCYTGTGSNRTVTHGLGVAPELIIVKSRGVQDWPVYSAALGANNRVRLNQNVQSAQDLTLWNNTAPTSSVFSLGTATESNQSTVNYVAYLFASCPGVSKVGSYTGTGNTLQIDCGFTGGARFVLIKRTDNTGDWYVWDSARGIVAGNDPYLLLNSTAAEVTTTDWVDTHNPGFELSNAVGNNVNINTATYIFLAIA